MGAWTAVLFGVFWEQKSNMSTFGELPTNGLPFISARPERGSARGGRVRHLECRGRTDLQAASGHCRRRYGKNKYVGTSSCASHRNGDPAGAHTAPDLYSPRRRRNDQTGAANPGRGMGHDKAENL